MKTLQNVFEELSKLKGNKPITVRAYEKSFGLFSNPVFLITFMSIVLLIGGYQLYHYYTKQDPNKCYNYNTSEECPDYCMWNNQDNMCLPKGQTGNVCPDYWSVKNLDNDSYKCVDDNNIALNRNVQAQQKMQGKKCHASDAGGKATNYITVNKNNGQVNDSMSKCDWMKSCGPWEGQSQGRFDCSSTNEKICPDSDAKNWPYCD